MDVLAQTWDEIRDTLRQRYGRGAYHAAALCRAVHRRGTTALSTLPEFERSPLLAARLTAEVRLGHGCLADLREAHGVVKFVTALDDGARVESVILPMPAHRTVCVSTQAGCRMGCRFCETGRLGLRRNLRPEEIVGQVWRARWELGADVQNVVFMGMGEPLDNFAAVMQAVRVLNDPRGPAIPERRMTLSTVGHLEGLARLAAWPGPRPFLALSLNAPTDALRSVLMPVNRRWPLDRLQALLRTYPYRAKERLFVEYVLLAGVNDGVDHARQLAAWLRPLRTKVNLIPCNRRTDGGFRPPSADRVARFRQVLVAEGTFVRLRTAKGDGLWAACGQLGRHEP